MNNNLSGHSIPIEDLSFDEIPPGKWEVFAYTYMYFIGKDVILHLVLKNLNEGSPQFEYISINIKSLNAYPLSRIIENKKLSTTQTNYEVIEADFDLAKCEDRQPAGNIPSLNIVLNEIPEQLEYRGKKFSVRKAFARQWFISVRDLNTKRIFYFPEYEICRCFYYTSASMIRALLKGTSLTSLYKGQPKLDSNTGKAEIQLNYSTNNNDAPNIFRFAINDYSFDQWILTKARIAANKAILKEECLKYGSAYNYEKTFLGGNFPIQDCVHMKLTCRQISETEYMALFINEENSLYPFDELTIIREKASNEGKDKPITIKNKVPPDITNLQNLVSSPPDVNNESIFIDMASENINTNHADLKNKKILSKLQINSEIKNSNPKSKTTSSDQDPDSASFSDNYDNKNSNVIPAETQQRFQGRGSSTVDQEELKLEKREHTPLLNAFHNMLKKYVTLYSDVELELFPQLPLPIKSSSSNSIRALYITCIEKGVFRLFTGGQLYFKGRSVFLLEIERDPIHLNSIGTLILEKKDGKTFTHSEIIRIMQNFVDAGGVWKESSLYRYKKHHMPHLKHGRLDDTDWAEKTSKWMNR